MLRAIVFDFDGVITDSEILHYRAFNEVLAGLGLQITKKDYYRQYLGLTDADVFRELIDNKLLNSAYDSVENLLEQKKQAFEKLAQTEGKIIDGVRDFLTMLKNGSIPMAICSGALLCEIEMILEGAKLRNFFEVIVSAEEVKRGKPHPEGLLLTLKKLCEKLPAPAAANQCVVIEDSHWGLEAAKKAGMHTVAITNSYDADQLRMAEKIIDHLSELSINDLNKLCV